METNVKPAVLKKENSDRRKRRLANVGGRGGVTGDSISCRQRSEQLWTTKSIPTW